MEDFRIRSDDNLVCIGVTNKDSYSIQLFGRLILVIL